MKFCTDHWDKLREAIKSRGLWHLVAKDGQELLECIKADLDNKQDNKYYDPLASATWMIYGNAMKYGGLYLMSTKPDGSYYCPLCEAKTHLGINPENNKDADIDWIDGCCDSIREYCIEQKLTKE